MNRLPWRLDPLNGTTGFTYNAPGNLLSVTNPRSNATTYAYVNMDRLTTRVDLLTRSESYQCDLAGDMTQLMDGKSKATKVWVWATGSGFDIDSAEKTHLPFDRTQGERKLY